MNQNIEVINKYLWAVKFRFIPFISEIEYKPDPQIPAYEEFGQVTNDGLLILNKDYLVYAFLKDMFQKLMKKEDKQLKNEIEVLRDLKNKNEWHGLYAAMLQVEVERRLKERGEWVNGNN